MSARNLLAVVGLNRLAFFPAATALITLREISAVKNGLLVTRTPRARTQPPSCSEGHVCPPHRGRGEREAAC